jgi:hypothetical protein
LLHFVFVASSVLNLFSVDLDTDRLIRAIEQMSFNIGKRLLDLEASVRVEIAILTPSVACKSGKKSEFSLFMKTLKLDLTAAVEQYVVQGEIINCEWPNHSHNWKANEAESSSYDPLVAYLQNTVGVTAHNIANDGDDLFDVKVHSLKSDATARSDVLRLGGSEPKFRFFLRGRTDVVILFPDCVAPCSHNVWVAVEVKPVGFIEKEGLREAVLQLVGLNVANDSHSPAVVLTNLARTHFVLYFDLMSDAPQRLAIRILKYEAFNLALSMALEMGNRPCFTMNFGSPPTPPSNFYSAQKR